MKKIQKSLLAILVLCLMVTVLAACGENKTTGDTTAGDTTTTGTVAEEGTYTFSVILEDTLLPVDGVKITLSRADVTLDPVTTNAVGIAKYKLGTAGYGEYTVQIDEDTVPAGYHVDETVCKTNAEELEYTIVLAKDVCQHEYKDDVCTLCGEKKCYSFSIHVQYGPYVKDESVRELPIADVQILITTETEQVAMGYTDAEGNFTFEAPRYTAEDGYSGYNIVIVDGTPKGYYFFDGLMFMAKELDVTIECYTKINNGLYTAFNPLKLVLDEDKTGISTDLSLSELWEDDEDTVQDDSLYFFSVRPSDPSHVGHYKITLTGIPEGVTVRLGHYASTTAMVSHDPQKSVTVTGGTLELEFIMEERYMRESTLERAWTYDNSWVFGIYVEGEENYPLQLHISIERDRDLIPGTDYTVTNKETIQIDENAKNMSDIFGDPSGKTLVAYTAGTAADVKVVLGEDGYYHIGSADGAILLVNINNPNDFFSGEASLATVNAVSGSQNLLYSWWEEDHYEVVYYHEMIMAYGNLCGTDGYYAVNEQLYDFLTKWTEQRVSDTYKGGLEENAYLLLCGYYA